MDARGNGVERPTKRGVARAVRASMIVVMAFASGSCASLNPDFFAPPYGNHAPEPPSYTPSDQPEAVRAVQEGVATATRAIVGKSSLRIGDRRYNLDCSGTVMAGYYAARVDLTPLFQQGAGAGVERLARIVGEYPSVGGEVGWTYEGRPAHVALGDIVLWDDTYDKNGNGRFDDPATHAGIVVMIDRDETIHYVHHNYRRGIIIERMNLRYPDDPTRNSAMRMRGQPDHGGRYLSSHLFRAAGSPYMILFE